MVFYEELPINMIDFSYFVTVQLSCYVLDILRDRKSV